MMGGVGYVGCIFRFQQLKVSEAAGFRKKGELSICKVEGKLENAFGFE